MSENPAVGDTFGFAGGFAANTVKISAGQADKAYERTAELVTELNRVTAERDELRRLVAEAEPLSVRPADDVKPAITGAGTEHLAAELAERAQPDDAAIKAWIRRNPQAFETWVRRQDRIHGGQVIA